MGVSANKNILKNLPWEKIRNSQKSCEDWMNCVVMYKGYTDIHSLFYMYRVSNKSGDSLIFLLLFGLEG